MLNGQRARITKLAIWLYQRKDKNSFWQKVNVGAYLSQVCMCKRKNTFSIIRSGTLLIRHLLAQRYTALEEVGDNQSKPKRRLDKKACMGHCFMAVSKRFKKRTKMKSQHILKLSTLKLNYKKKTTQN